MAGLSCLPGLDRARETPENRANLLIEQLCFLTSFPARHLQGLQHA